MAYENLTPISLSGWSISKVPDKWQHFWDNLDFCLPGWDGAGGPIDLASGRVGTLVSTVGYTQSPHGISLLFSGGTTAVTFADNAIWQNPGSVTVAALHAPSATTTTSILTRTDSSSGGAYWALIFGFPTASRYSLWNDNSSLNLAEGATTIATNSNNFVVGRRVGDHAADPTLDIFVNGIVDGTASNVGLDSGWDFTGDGVYGAAINRFGNYIGYTGSSIMGPVYLWNRALSDAEIAMLSENPLGPLLQVDMSLSALLNMIVTGQTAIPVITYYMQQRRR